MGQTRIIKRIEVIEGDATHLEIELRYAMGGMNYFTGENIERGLKISVQPVKIGTSECGKFNSKSFVAFTGVAQHLISLKRFNQKTFDNYQVDQKVIDELVTYVTRKQGLKLKEETKE